MIAAANSSVSYLAVLKIFHLKLIWTVTNLSKWKAVVGVCLRVRERDREKVGERKSMWWKIGNNKRYKSVTQSKQSLGTHDHRTSLFTVFHV